MTSHGNRVIQYYTEDERRVLFDIFDREFDSDLPHDDQANILAIRGEGELPEAFVVCEFLLRADMWWVREDLRDTPRAAGHIRALARHLLETIPQGMSVITFAGCDTHRRIFDHLGMRYVPGDVYRLDK